MCRAGYARTNHTHMHAHTPAPQAPFLRIGGVISAIALLTATSLIFAQRPPQDGPPAGAPPSGNRGQRSNRPGGDPNAKRENIVSITTEGNFRVIKSNGWPD